jgi:hypothetical protein
MKPIIRPKRLRYGSSGGLFLFKGITMTEFIPPLHIQQEARGMLRVAQDTFDQTGDVDYWMGIGFHWDVNIHNYGMSSKLQCSIYPNKVNDSGYYETDTSRWFTVTLED